MSVSIDTYSKAYLQINWRHLLQPGDTVIVVGECVNIVASRAKVQRITHTGLIVVKSRHYNPVTGYAITRRGWIEEYSDKRWGEMCAAAEDATGGLS